MKRLQSPFGVVLVVVDLVVFVCVAVAVFVVLVVVLVSVVAVNVDEVTDVVVVVGEQPSANARQIDCEKAKTGSHAFGSSPWRASYTTCLCIHFTYCGSNPFRVCGSQISSVGNDMAPIPNMYTDGDQTSLENEHP
jgi:hypothetical protein